MALHLAPRRRALDNARSTGTAEPDAARVRSRSLSDQLPIGADFLPIRVDLAKEPPFRLGAMSTNPSASEVEWGDAREVLQPKVMKVLVALAGLRGQVVSRAQLIEACWDGREVGDDAINRCIGQLRRLADRTKAFSVETIPRVGHRLAVPDDARALAKFRWPAMVAGALVLIATVAGAVGLWIARHPPAEQSPRVQVASLRVIGSEPDVHAFAASLSDDVVGILNETGVQTTVAGRKQAIGSSTRADLALRGSVAREGGILKVRIFLDDPRAGLTLWSGQFQQPVAEAESLRDSIAVAATESIYTALEPRQQPGLKLDPETLAIHIRGSELVRSPQVLREGEARRAFEQVVAKAPNFAGGHGTLAVALAVEASAAPAQERAQLLRRVRREAEAAINIYPSAAGAAYDALYMARRIEAPVDVVAAEDQLLAGLRRAPEFPFLNMRECRLLVEVGRAAAALRYCQRAIALRPLAGPIGYSYARALNAAGERLLAEEAIERAVRRNPDHAQTRLARFELAAFGGSADRAVGLLRNPDTRPQMFTSNGVAAMEAFLAARLSGRAKDGDVSLQMMRAAADAGRLDRGFELKAAAALGRTEAAFATMRELNRRTAPGGWGSSLLDPVMTPLRQDPRFWQAAAQAGLAQYWTHRNVWPDFCGAEIPAAVCRLEAMRAIRQIGWR